MAPGNNRPQNNPINPFSGEKSVDYMNQLRDKAKETALPHLKQSFYPVDVKNFYETKYNIRTLAEYDSKAGFPEVYEFAKQSTKEGAKLVLKRLEKLYPYRDLLSQSISPAKIRVQIKSRMARMRLRGAALNSRLEDVMNAYKEYRLVESFIRNRIFGAHENVSRMREKVSSQVEVSWVDKSREGIEKLFNTVGKKNRNLSTTQMWAMVGGVALLGYFGIKAAAGKFSKTAEFFKKWGGRGLWLAGGLGVGSLVYRWWNGRWPVSDAQKWYNEKREVPSQWKNVFCKLNGKYCQSSSEIDTTINSAGRVLTYAGTKLSIEQARDKYLSARNTDKKVSVPGLVLKSELNQHDAFKGLNAINDIFASEGAKGDGLVMLAKNHPGMSLIAAFYAEITRRGAIKELVKGRAVAHQPRRSAERIIGAGASLDYLTLHSSNAETNRRLQEGARTVFGMPAEPQTYMKALFKVANKYFKDIGGVSKAAALKIMTQPKAIGWNSSVALGTGKTRKEICGEILAKFKAVHPGLHTASQPFRQKLDKFITDTKRKDRALSYPGSIGRGEFIKSFRTILGSTMELAYAGDKKAKNNLNKMMSYFHQHGLQRPLYVLSTGLNDSLSKTGYIPAGLPDAGTFDDFKDKLKYEVCGATFANFNKEKRRLSAGITGAAGRKLTALSTAYKALNTAIMDPRFVYNPTNATKALRLANDLKLNMAAFSIEYKRLTPNIDKTSWGEYYENAQRFMANNRPEYRKAIARGVLPRPTRILHSVLRNEMGRKAENFSYQQILRGHGLHMVAGKTEAYQIIDAHNSRFKVQIVKPKSNPKAWRLRIWRPSGWVGIRKGIFNDKYDIHDLTIAAVTAMNVINEFKKKQIVPNDRLSDAKKKAPFSVENGQVKFASGAPTSINPLSGTFWGQIKFWHWGFDKGVKKKPPVDKKGFARLLNALWYKG